MAICNANDTFYKQLKELGKLIWYLQTLLIEQQHSMINLNTT